MKNKLLSILIGCVFTLNANAEGVQLKPEHKIGKVGDEEFTIMDWNTEFVVLDPQVKAQGKDKLFLPLRNAIIEKIALKKQAMKMGLHNTEEFKATMRKAERDILSRLYFDKKLKPITNKQLRAEYKLFKKEFGKAQQVKARHILVKKRGSAEKIIKALKSGAVDFVAIAKSKSIGPSGKNGGDLGWVSRGQMVPSFEKALFALKDGEISQKAVKTQFGWHIIKREESRTQKVPEFKEVKQMILGRARQRQAQDLIEKAIKANKVSVFDEKGNEIK